MTPIDRLGQLQACCAPLFIRVAQTRGLGTVAVSLIAAGAVIAGSVAASAGDPLTASPTWRGAPQIPTVRSGIEAPDRLGAGPAGPPLVPSAHFAARPPEPHMVPRATPRPARVARTPLAVSERIAVNQPVALWSSEPISPVPVTPDASMTTPVQRVPSAPAAAIRVAATPVAARPIEQSRTNTPAKAEPIPADVALRRLIAGNQRFVRDIDHITRRDTTRRTALAGAERPFAVVLCGSDSRIPPEMVFDTDLGDVFAVRIVGNFADDITVGSIEYAVEHLEAKLVVVMGHRCGAVKAAVNTARVGRSASDLPGHFGAVIAPLMTSARETAGQAGDPSTNALVRNVQRTVLALRTSAPTIERLVATKGVRVVGAVYDLETGAVDFIRDAYERTPPAGTSVIARQK